jgi:hypothetical protein
MKKNLNDISNNDISNNDISNNDISNNDISNNDISNNDISNNDISNNDISNNLIKNKFLLIKVTIVLIAIEFKLLLLIGTIKDRCILYFAIYGQILLIFSLLKSNSFLIEVSHLIFGLTILLILFCSFNPYLNIYCYNVLLFTLITRYIYGGCLLLNCNENNKSFLPDYMDFSYIYKTMFCLMMAKIIYIFNN